jgi:hypothetical protein
MIRIAITPAAYEAIAATLALGTVAVEPEPARDGTAHICARSGRRGQAQGCGLPIALSRPTPICLYCETAA